MTLEEQLVDFVVAQLKEHRYNECTAEARAGIRRDIADDVRELIHDSPGVQALATVLKRMRSELQGGYVTYNGGGKWAFVSTGLPQTYPEELNALFTLAGIVPDKIVSLGDCADCANSRDGASRGWDRPCSSCASPRMSNFVPKHVVKARKKASGQ